MTKLMEKIINTRLIWFLEKNNIINKEQSGFRRSRSTVDNLHIIKSEIDLALENKQSLGMLSLDISKAYDSVWKHRVLIILIKASNLLSPLFSQRNGIPQGSSLEVTIFLLAINDIVETIRTPVTANLFADDFNIRALIRSKAEYGSSIFSTANQKYLKMFNTPLNTELRFALGAFKSSPIESLRNLANELPPDLRRTYNTLLYTARSLINIENSSNKYLAKNIKKAEE
ncbi:Reverse transcriptase domain-containing protein [Aphis craccivora]|uniref:Reverse transcriptase domain-containing protein n=1 Tax=Aphis craccivora TaxID=307492 RepID=A0A6G0ZFJ2_APHCR|nr:Reverse transcriptase domain-containing protein [Aphis craccivora]